MGEETRKEDKIYLIKVKALEKEPHETEQWRESSDRHDLLECEDAKEIREGETAEEVLARGSTYPKHFSGHMKMFDRNFRGVKYIGMKYPVLNEGFTIDSNPGTDISVGEITDVLNKYGSIIIPNSTDGNSFREIVEITGTLGFTTKHEYAYYVVSRGKAKKRKRRRPRGAVQKIKKMPVDRMERKGKVRVHLLRDFYSGSLTEELMVLLPGVIERTITPGDWCREFFIENIILVSKSLRLLTSKRKATAYRKNGNWAPLIIACLPMLSKMRKNGGADAQLARWISNELKETGGRDKWHAKIKNNRKDKERLHIFYEERKLRTEERLHRDAMKRLAGI